jgi:cysteinyl-tRNA synthetase
MFEIATEINAWNNKQKPIEIYSLEAIENLKAFFHEIIYDVFGLKKEEKSNSGALDATMKLIIDLRAKARESKDWTTSDQIRDQLASAGIAIKDQKDGESSYTVS